MWALLSLSAFVLAVVAQDKYAEHPLAELRIPYNAIPYQVDTQGGDRGAQSGYNICNSTTEGPTSLCQTAYINDITDWCLWGPQQAGGVVGNIEGEMIAYCTKPGHGTRLMPAGAITGLQFIKTPGYLQVTGTIKQDLINIAADDNGGEMDPHGADGRGNPIGSLVYSSGWSNQVEGYTQAIEWHNFMGANQFCFKACDPAGPNAAQLCQHIFDRIGCGANAPAKYEEGVFESCLGDNQDPPGVYTGANGQVSTFTQPPEGVEPVLPYTPKVPASSQCTPFDSASLFAAAPTALPAGGSASASASAASGGPTASASRAPGGSAVPTVNRPPSGGNAPSASAGPSASGSANNSTGAGSVSVVLPVYTVGALALLSVLVVAL